ncbi:MAG: hypothetical protein KF796_17160 [Ramlibacter sp.]|nr:hypothetical protein [Ramlibacter sp.]
MTGIQAIRAALRTATDLAWMAWRRRTDEARGVLGRTLLVSLVGIVAACGGASQDTSQVAKEVSTAAPIAATPQSDVDAWNAARKPDAVASYMPPPETVPQESTQRLRGARPSVRQPARVALPALPSERRHAVLSMPREPGVPRLVAQGRASSTTHEAADVAQKLIWEMRPGGVQVAALQMSSPGASGLRMGVRVDQLPDQAQLRFVGADGVLEHVFTAIEVKEVLKRNRDAGDLRDFARVFWSPYMDGDTLTVEFELPAGAEPSQISVAVPLLSHFFESPSASPDINEPRIGESASCHADVSCYAESGLSNATAKMVFTADGGGSYLCSGTLLNDRASSGTPYFLSANHCISKQSVASTLQTFWFYRSTSCNSGRLSASSVSRSGGATLLYSSARTDTSFMRLGSTPPPGVIYAGWSASGPSVGTGITGVHHPAGDLQKVSYGSLSGYKTCLVTNPTTGGFTCQNSNLAASTFFDVLLTTGTTEGGSSGSGLFANVGGLGKVLVGQLYGGSSSCSNRSGTNIYGRFDVAYNAALNLWLDAAGNPTTYVLSVAKQGTGDGTVASVPGGISCGGACSASFGAGTQVVLTASPAAGSTFGGWSGACTGTQSSCVVSMASAKNVVASFVGPSISLATALDNSALTWSTGGNAAFFAQTAAYTTGGSAVRSGGLADLQSSSLSTVVAGPGQLSFDWKVSSEADYDFLTVSIDGVAQYRISGESTWITTVLNIPAGSHAVKWEYAKDAFVADGEDAGWVDHVVYAQTAAAVSALRNGDFEAGGQGWVASSSLIVLQPPSRIPPVSTGSTRVAWFCGYSGCLDTLYQDISIASGASSALLSFSYYVETLESTLSRVYDYLTVEIRSVASSARLALLTTISNLSTKNRWQTFSADLSAYAGQTVRLLFTGISDLSLTSSFYVDNVSLNVVSGAPVTGVEPQNGWWWNASEGGRGFAIERQGTKIFIGGFMYETNGVATWYVSTLTRQANGSYTGEFTRYAGGQTLTGSFRSPSSTSKVADLVLNFSASTSGTLVVTPVGGTASTISLQRFPISTPTSFATSNAAFESGWWWNAEEPGRGYFIEVQGNQAFLVVFTYEASGQPTWYVANGSLAGSQGLSGVLQQYGNGQSLQGSYRTPSLAANPGSLFFVFSSAKAGSLVLPDGRLINLNRFTF